MDKREMDILTTKELIADLMKYPDDTPVVLFDPKSYTGYKTPLTPMAMSPSVELIVNRDKKTHGHGEFVTLDVYPNTKAKKVKCYLIC
jgi:hypothetical protein